MAEINALVARVISGSEIAINAGADQGIRTGDAVTVWRSVEIKDPKSGASLGAFLQARLQLDVSLVDDLFCLARVRIQVPNFTAAIFGKQTKWITGAGAEENERVPLKLGDEVTVYTSDEVDADQAEESKKAADPEGT
tara:strand:- start:48863 stop:49276 length:414 start_codon:yes stop_codon:yes gene_type:complete